MARLEPTYNAKEEAALHRQYKEGDAEESRLAYQALVSSQIGWGKKLAKQYCGLTHWHDRDAAVSAAWFGICLAVERFDPTIGRLSTYVTPWALREMHKEKRNSGAISFPQYTDMEGRPSIGSMNAPGVYGDTPIADLEDKICTKDPEKEAHEELVVELMYQAIADLEESDRQMLLAIIVKNVSRSQYGATQGLSRQAISHRMRRLRQRLNTRIKEKARA